MENTNENITAAATDEMIVGLIAKKLGLRERQVAGTVNLLKGGATIPFISRYRKETTGGLNEVQIAEINENPERTARQFLNDEVPDVEAALSGARDIIAEHVNEDEQARQSVRRSYQLTAVVRSKVVKGKEEEGAKFRDYFDWQEPLRRCSSHRMLAMLRGEAEGFLKVSILPADDDDCRSRVARRFVRPGSAAAQQVELAVADAYKRLLRPSIETEFAAWASRKPTKRLYACLPKTCANSCSQPRSAKSALWASTPATARAARSFASIATACCSTTKPSIPIRRAASMPAPR